MSALKRALKAECIAGCKEKVFFPKPRKKFGTDSSCRFRGKRTFNSEKWRHQSEG